MKVLILKGAVGPEGLYKKGAVVDLKEDTAKQLIKDGIAEAVKGEAKPEDVREKALSPKATKRNKR